MKKNLFALAFDTQEIIIEKLCCGVKQLNTYFAVCTHTHVCVCVCLCLHACRHALTCRYESLPFQGGESKLKHSHWSFKNAFLENSSSLTTDFCYQPPSCCTIQRAVAEMKVTLDHEHQFFSDSERIWVWKLGSKKRGFMGCILSAEKITYKFFILIECVLKMHMIYILNLFAKTGNFSCYGPSSIPPLKIYTWVFTQQRRV